MPKLFWMLLAAGRGARIYLRSVLRAAAGLVSRLGQAPGSEVKAPLERDTSLDAGMVNRAVSDGRLDARAGGSLAGHMVAWLVSVAYPTIRAGLAALLSVLSGAPGAGMGKDTQPCVDLTAGADTGTGMPGNLRSERGSALVAAAGDTPHAPMLAPLETSPALLGRGASGLAVPTAAAMTPNSRMDAGMGAGAPGAIRTEPEPVSSLTACMMTWTAPEWVDDKTLYIRQVYETERDGTTLILH